MIGTQNLVDGYALNARVIQMQADGLTHADSLLQLPFRGNCLNWVIGHILADRDEIFTLLLGEQGLLSKAQYTRYKSDSEPITLDSADVIGLEELLALLAKSQQVLAEKIGGLSLEEAESVIEVKGREKPLDEWLFGFYFHETYHTGQTEILRQLAGKDD
ncbi:MAG: hypothetical protein JXB38_15560 [Anaerolineales bacterium]|nr:hypothetical protein [Anaerolineales bacterium]